MKRAVFPGSFDPLTIAHVAIAEAALQYAALDYVELAVSNAALAKDVYEQHPVAARLAAIERAATERPW